MVKAYKAEDPIIQEKVKRWKARNPEASGKAWKDNLIAADPISKAKEAMKSPTVANQYGKGACKFMFMSGAINREQIPECVSAVSSKTGMTWASQTKEGLDKVTKKTFDEKVTAKVDIAMGQKFLEVGDRVSAAIKARKDKFRHLVGMGMYLSQIMGLRSGRTATRSSKSKALRKALRAAGKPIKRSTKLL